MSIFSLIKRCIPAKWKLLAKSRFVGGHLRLRTPDRRLLEESVIPGYRDLPDVSRVLDIGCDWYTKSYQSLFAPCSYRTIDFDPEKARHAPPGHVTGSLLELDRHFDAGSFDLVLCNGVLGWGVNTLGECAEASRQLARVLRPGGHLVLGWNDHPGRKPEGLACFDEAPWKPFAFPTLPGGPGDHVLTETSYRHRYDFRQKSGPAAGAAV